MAVNVLIERLYDISWDQFSTSALLDYDKQSRWFSQPEHYPFVPLYCGGMSLDRDRTSIPQSHYRFVPVLCRYVPGQGRL